MSTYETDFAWQAKYLPAIRTLLGPYLLREAPLKIDQTEATDLMVLGARDMRIACRLRQAEYAARYPFEFTVRSNRESGAETECRKVMRGFGDWMFYGWVTSGDELALQRWMILDLDAFRAHHILNPSIAKTRKEQDNRDGTQFFAYDVRSFPPDPNLIIGASFLPGPAERAKFAQTCGLL